MIRQGIEINLESVKCHFSTSDYYKTTNIHSTTTSNHIPPSLLSTCDISSRESLRELKLTNFKEVTNPNNNIISNLNIRFLPKQRV